LITNPPFKLFNEFATRAIDEYDNVALLARLQALEGLKRYDTIWSARKPSAILVFKKRLHMVRGRLPTKSDGASTMAFAWFLWYDTPTENTIIDWI